MSKVVIYQVRNGMYVQFNTRGERVATEFMHLAQTYESGDDVRKEILKLNQEGVEFAVAPYGEVPVAASLSRSDWHKVSVRGAKAIAETLDVKNTSQFVNQVPHMRALLMEGRLKELEEYVLGIQNSNVAIGYPNSHTYYNG